MIVLKFYAPLLGFVILNSTRILSPPGSSQARAAHWPAARLRAVCNYVCARLYRRVGHVLRGGTPRRRHLGRTARDCARLCGRRRIAAVCAATVRPRPGARRPFLPGGDGCFWRAVRVRRVLSDSAAARPDRRAAAAAVS